MTSPMPSNPYGYVEGGLRLDGIADMILQQIVRTFARAEVALPERRYVAAGTPRDVAWDCEQLTVALSGIGWGPASDRSVGSRQPGSEVSALAMRHAVYAISLVRPYPVWDPEQDPHEREFPPAEQLHERGLAHLRDSGLLSQSLVSLCSTVQDDPAVKHLRGMGGPYGLVLPGLVESIGPSGGFVSVETSLTVTAGEVA